MFVFTDLANVFQKTKSRGSKVGTVFKTRCQNRFLQVSCLFVFTDLAYKCFSENKISGLKSRDRFQNTVSKSFPPGLMFRVWVQSQANPGGRITAQGSTNFHVLIQTRLSTQLLLENFQGSVYPLPFLAFPLKQSKHIKTMAFLEPLLELLRLQQCYQSVHGCGSLHLLSKDENEDEHEDEHHDHDHDHDHEHHDHDDDDDDDDDDADDADADVSFILSFLFEPYSGLLSKT